jgi:hypothetical protein
MNRIITYGIQPDGTVISRVGGEIAFPVLDFGAIGQGGDGYAPGDFRGPTRYNLEKYPIHPYFREGEFTYPEVRWTRKIPVTLKNLHRVFWGFRPLPAEIPVGRNEQGD